MRLASALAALACLASCDIGKITVNTTSKVLLRAQPSLQQEADYELARQAIPGALKTIEGFWIVDPENPRLIRILTEGYCQYGTAFVEDDWEVAKFKKDLEQIEYHNTRSTHIFTRCLNYALTTLGPRWRKEIFGTPEVVAKLIKDTGHGQRFPLLFAGLALGSLINHNLTRIEMLAHLSTVQLMLERVVEIDAKHGAPTNKSHAALPHVALGMLHTGRAKSMGGEPEKGKASFEQALAITDQKFLLARTLMAYRVGLAMNDRKFFHDELKKVLETPPSVWPEQRLANEVAHRKARRYLSKEKELFQ
ncbi:MAG: TRAP transporter TatT component family protein [Kofleriaceae bacterium]